MSLAEIEAIGAYKCGDTLCWSCARATASPDPFGCAFHRLTDERQTEGQPFQKALARKSKYSGRTGYTVYIVTECENYKKGWRE